MSEIKRIAQKRRDIEWIESSITGESYGIETKTYVELGEVIRRVEQAILNSELRDEKYHILVRGMDIRAALGKPYSEYDQVKFKQIVGGKKEDYDHWDGEYKEHKMGVY